MEREGRHIPTEELIIGAALSLIRSRFYPHWPELVRRFAAGSLVSVALASNYLINQAASESKKVFQ